MIARIPIKSQQTRKNKEDNDLEQRLVNFLHARRVPGSDSVRLDAHAGRVIIRGLLSSARAKWLCLECCRHVAGVIKLVDEIVVQLPRQRTDAEPSEQSSRSSRGGSLVVESETVAVGAL